MMISAPSGNALKSTMMSERSATQRSIFFRSFFGTGRKLPLCVIWVNLT